jgi:hypothetical protein
MRKQILNLVERKNLKWRMNRFKVTSGTLSRAIMDLIGSSQIQIEHGRNWS